MKKVKVRLPENVKYFGALGISWIISWFLGYIYHPMMLRMLNLADFSALQTLVSIFNILSVFTAWVCLYITQIVAGDDHPVAKSKRIFWGYTKDMTLVGIGLFLVFLASIPILRDMFDIYNTWALLLTGSILIIGFVVVVADGVLLGLQKFILIAKLDTYGAIAKFVIGWLWVFLGAGIVWAIGWYVWLMVVYLIFYFLYTYKFLGNYADEHLLDAHLLRSKNIVSITHYSILCILLTVLANIDILIARLLFSGEVSGTYAAISTLSKWIVFLSALLESIYFPQLVRVWSNTGKILLQALAMYAGIFVMAILFIRGIWDITLDIVKWWLHTYTTEFARLTVWSLLVSLITFWTKVLLWRRVYSANVFLFLLLIIILLVSQYIHFVSLQAYIYSLCIICGLGSVCVGGYVWYKLRRTSKQIA